VPQVTEMCQCNLVWIVALCSWPSLARREVGSVCSGMFEVVGYFGKSYGNMLVTYKNSLGTVSVMGEKFQIALIPADTRRSVNP